MIRRNPHVFRPDGSLQDSFPATVAEIVRKWDDVKRSEKLLHTEQSPSGNALDGVPAALPALARAQKLLDRAERAGLVSAGGTAVVVPDTEEELGELLFGIAAAARANGLDAERALRGAARRFQDSHVRPPTP
jgi:XTP/dITP diphosphohydrolase